MEAALAQLVKFLLPPSGLLVLYLAGVLLVRRRPRLSAWARHGAVALLYVMSTGVGAWLLLRPLEALEPPLTQAPEARAVVVLTAGRIKKSPEYGGRAAPDFTALARMTYAARVVRTTGLPLLVTGGVMGDDEDEEALALGMRRVFQDHYGIPVRWVETASRTTGENARYSAAILKKAGIGHVILVTNAMHMRRARRAFEQQGIVVTPAPTFYQSSAAFNPLGVMPSAENLRRSHFALYEWLGMAWYYVAGLRAPA